MINWDKVEHFSSKEFDDPDVPGSGEQIDGVTLLCLESLRRITGWPIRTHWEVGGCVDVKGTHGHASRSFHRLDQGAKAVDFHFVTSANTREQFHAVCCGRFSGIGVYYNWQWGNKLLSIGFHVDTRPIKKAQIWVCENNHEYHYLLK